MWMITLQQLKSTFLEFTHFFADFFCEKLFHEFFFRFAWKRSGYLFKVKFRLHFLQLWILYLNFLVENFEISSNSIQYLGCWRCLAGVENWDKKINEKKNSNKKINMLNTLLAYHRLPFQQDSVVSCNSNY